MIIHFKYEKQPKEIHEVEAAAIADDLRNRLVPLQDAIEEAGAELTLYYQENGVCRLIIDAPVELQKQISDLVGPAETWS